MNRCLTYDSNILHTIDATVAGTTDINGAVVAHNGARSVTHAVKFGAITATAVTSIKVQDGELSDGSDMADITGATVSVADDDDGLIARIELVNPSKPYSRVVVDRGTANAVIDYGIAIVSNVRDLPDPYTTIGNVVINA